MAYGKPVEGTQVIAGVHIYIPRYPPMVRLTKVAVLCHSENHNIIPKIAL